MVQMGQQDASELSSISAGKLRLRQATELSSTIISLSYSIKVFTVKWQMIRNKLQDLLSGLTDIENRDSGEESALSGDYIQAIIDTLLLCHDFGNKCIELKFSGKLLMQSDLSILVSKIDDHIKCLSEIYVVGLLAHSNALVVQKPGAMASRDDMKFFVNDILSRLKIGDTHMKKLALIALNDVIKEDERYVKICVETDGIVSILVNFLDSEVIEIREEAAKGVCLISQVDVYRGVLASAGIIAPLIRVLECGSEVAKECAARCLKKVTENSDNSWSVSAHGGVSVLLKIVKSVDGCGSELVGLACGVLKNLAGVEEINKFMVEEGAIVVSLGLLKSKDEIVLLSSMDYLQTMASTDESNRDLIVKGGGICVLIHILDPKFLVSSKAREMAFRGIKSLCLKSESSLNIVMNSGLMDHVLYFLRYGEVSMQELALKASFWLCETSEEAQKAMGDAGFMPELVKFLDAKSFEVREMSAEILSIMVSVPRNRKRFVQNAQNVGLVVQLLDQDDGNLSDRKVLLSIITSLVSSNTGRRSIVNSGHLRNIEKLAAAEVSDAKKIVRKLSSNKFTSLFSGIWHS